MIRLRYLVGVALLLTLAGCTGPKLVTGGYYLQWDMPRREQPVTVQAAVSTFEEQVSIQTFNWQSMPLSLRGAMRFGGLDASATGSRGPHVEKVTFNGEVISEGEAAGEFEYFRSGQKIMQGDWRLVQQELFLQRQAARRATEGESAD
jgi:hypothetical protein